MYPKFIIIRKWWNNSVSNGTVENGGEFNYNKKYYELSKDEDYISYIKKYGHHFNHKLSEYASDMLKNSNSQKHSWSYEQVNKVMGNLGMKIPKEMMGDSTYAANLAYAMFYPSPISEEIMCFEISHKMLMNPNGYLGKMFDEWVHDMMKKDKEINWKSFI